MDYTKLPNYEAAVGKYTDAVANGADEKNNKNYLHSLWKSWVLKLLKNLLIKQTKKLTL